MYPRIIAAVVGLLLVGSGLAAAQSGFTDTFDGAPPAPQPYTVPVPGLAAWDVVVHSRDVNTWAQLEPMDAHHGPACEAPPATHPTLGSYGDAVFACANHFMTAIRASGYGLIYTTPPVVADWTDTPTVIQWDMSTARSSDRDWVDLWVTPYDQNLVVPLEDWLPDLQGPPKRAIHIRMDNTGGNSMFRTAIYWDNFTGAEVSTQNYIGYETVLTPSAARRDTFQLTVSRTHIKFGMPAYNLWWMDGDVADLGFTSGVVQFGHHSYNPYKDCSSGSSVLPISRSVPGSITGAAMPHGPSSAVDVGIGILRGIGVPLGADSHFRPATFGNRSTSSEVSPLAVHAMRHGLQMSGVAANTVPTQVVDIQALYAHPAKGESVSQAMGAHLAIVEGDSAISLTVHAEDPRPATLRPTTLVDSGPEQFNTSSNLVHALSSPSDSITCGPNTWHWDAVSITPSSPFTITKAPQEYVSNLTASNLVTFPAPAQTGDHLRFAGAGDQYQVSLDGGVTWQAAPIQPQERNAPDKFQSYWMPVPAGTQQVNVRAQGGWWGQDWLARDFTLWGQVQAPPSRRTPTPTGVPATPTQTATPVPTNAPTQTPPPSSTPAPTPTDLPTPTTPPTVTATPPTTPAPTATTGPRCERVDIVNGALVNTPLPDGQCFQQ